MQIFIRNIDGKSLLLDVDERDTIYNVKVKLFDKYRIPVEYQRLSHSSKELNDEFTIFEYKIKIHDTLHLLFRLLSCYNCGNGNCLH